MRIKLTFAIILLFAMMLSFSSCDFFGDDSGSGGSDPVYYAIGDTGPSGVGVVFYITDGGLHGLEAAPGDIDDNGRLTFAWSTITDALANGSTALPKGIEYGASNTRKIIDQNNGAASAAKMCSVYDGGSKTDWFLPSIDALNELYKEKDTVGGFKTGFYWSSSEYGSTGRFAYLQYFESDDSGYSDKVNEGRLRAIRAF